VKLADLNDHLAHPTLPADTPPYVWARKRLAMGRDRGALAGRGLSDRAAASAASPRLTPDKGVSNNG
jgi:hypothetical protein